MEGVKLKKKLFSRKAAAWIVALTFAAMAFALVACAGSGTDQAADDATEATTEEAATPEEAASTDEAAQAESADAAAPATTEAAPAAAAEPEVVSGTVTTTIDMSGYDQGKPVRVWVPVASDVEYQVITDAAVDGGDAAARAEITTDALGNKMAYIEWDADADPASRVATVSFHAERTEALVRDMVEDESAGIPDDIAEKYLASDQWVAADDPEVKALSDEICAGKETTLDKAKAIYDWIYDNMNRNNDVFRCGDGDVCRLIQEDEREGKCTDINSTFVALCRAQGIPANEVFGIRMNDADITGNQHCWAEFYLPGTGWVPVDPADVLKAVLNDELAKDSEEALAKKDYYWGAWDAKRVQYSEGRDLTLEPAQDAGPLNNFGYPYAEVDGEPIDQCAPDEFVFSVAFEEN